MPGLLFGTSLERNECKLKYEPTQTLLSWHGRPWLMISYRPGVVGDASERRFGGLSWVSAASGWMLPLPVTIARQF